MKKIITIAFLFISILFNLNYVSAYSREYKCELNLYTQEIEKINQKYNTNYYILDENDFLNSELKEKFIHQRMLLIQKYGLIHVLLLDQKQCCSLMEIIK